VPLELKYEWTGVEFELRVSIGGQHKLGKLLGSEKARIRLTGLCAIPSFLRLGRNGDLLPYLEAHLKILRDLVQIVPKLIRGRWSIERGVIADGAKAGLTVVEILTIFTETFPRKAVFAYFFR
jgi:hypothetical protein